MRKIIKNILQPLRKLAGRFVAVESFERELKPIDLAARYICSEDIAGDYLEFGVFKGCSFIEAYHKIERGINEWSNIERAYQAYSDRQRAEEFFNRVGRRAMRYFAFDSFDGLPELKGVDKGHPIFCKGRYDCNERDFRRNIQANGVDMSKVITVPGFYDKSLTDDIKKRHGIKAASIIMVDCDLYESAKAVLDFITDLVGDGTIIIFDDWFSFKARPDLGEQRACKEWLEQNPGISLIEYARWGMGQVSFIVHK